MNFSIQSKKIDLFNAEASLVGHSSYIVQLKINDNPFKIWIGALPRRQRVEIYWQNRMQRTHWFGHKMFLRYICPKVLDVSVTLYIDISLIINGSFIVAHAFYAHGLCPRLDKMCMKIYANSRYKDKSAQTVVCQSKHSS